MAKTVDLKCGDRKFSTSQNFTGAEVRFVTDSIIIRMRRSYRWPLAREKTCTVSSSSFAAATAAASPPAAASATDFFVGFFFFPVTSDDTFDQSDAPPSLSLPLPLPPSLTVSRSSSSSFPSCFRTTSFVIRAEPTKSWRSTSWNVAAAVPSARGRVASSNRSVARPSARRMRHRPGAAWSWK